MKIKLMIVLASFSIANLHASYRNQTITPNEIQNALIFKRYMDCMEKTSLMAVPKVSSHVSPQKAYNKYHDALQQCRSQSLENKEENHPNYTLLIHQNKN